MLCCVELLHLEMLGKTSQICVVLTQAFKSTVLAEQTHFFCLLLDNASTERRNIKKKKTQKTKQERKMGFHRHNSDIISKQGQASLSKTGLI